MPLIAEGKERLDRFVARMMPDYSRTRIVRAIKGGEVTVEGEVATMPSLELKTGQVVEVGEIPEPEPLDLEPADIPLDVRYEDDDMLVVNKPRGMASHPAPGLGPTTLVNALLARSHDLSDEGGGFRPGIVHRLDKDTTGLMLVAKNNFAHVALADQIRDRTAGRCYAAFVAGETDKDQFSIDAPIGRHHGIPTLMTVKQTGKPAITHVRKLCNVEAGWLVACKLETGRTHQIRVHLSVFGWPIRGDALYAKPPWSKGPLQLHAGLLSFVHPRTNKACEVYAEPPADFIHRDMIEREGLIQWK